MKQLKIKEITLLFMLLLCNICIAQQDSIKIKELENRIEKTEGFQTNTEKALDNKFTSLENKINDDNYFIKLALGVGLGINLIFVIGLLIGAEKYVKTKLNQKFDNIIDQQEGNILEVIDKQDVEKQILKAKKILVLTAKNGDDTFVRKFFKTMGFQIDNVNYEKVDSYKVYDGYDLIFANNEDTFFDEELIQEYFEKSKAGVVLFFFGKSFTKGQNVTTRMSFANSRTQIYGNLLNLLKYQEVLK
jgi:hypothetical protein